jgi:alkyl hydroperoxide reductase subunit AhpF
VIVASGTRQKRLEVPGEKEFIMRGLCYSALSYAPLFIDKKTAVIGEGDLALRSAAELALMAEQVHVIGPGGSSLDTPLGRKLRAAPNVHLLERYRVTAVQGNGFAEKVVVQSPEGQETVLEVDGAFVELGLTPNAQMVSGLVDLDESGRIIVDCAARTSRAGIFAAGDVTNLFAEQVLIAMGEGAKAALSAYDYLLPRL